MKLISLLQMSNQDKQMELMRAMMAQIKITSEQNAEILIKLSKLEERVTTLESNKESASQGTDNAPVYNKAKINSKSLVVLVLLRFISKGMDNVGTLRLEKENSRKTNTR
ncbi:hypothetical protein [Sweet potato vein clearing virus]|uniref:Uncharacterized protein n=1 Tax=Sweet potato vein clearing virus TaxID=995049 RepID=F2XXZ4_9VIRU|nr:hypothetical protein SPVCVp8 [Sweet potato vein clearing virus]ADZ45065.1 hypothetical protein [Sweet potato vein clearing virus]